MVNSSVKINILVWSYFVLLLISSTSLFIESYKNPNLIIPTSIIIAIINSIPIYFVVNEYKNMDEDISTNDKWRIYLSFALIGLIYITCIGFVIHKIKDL